MCDNWDLLALPCQLCHFTVRAADGGLGEPNYQGGWIKHFRGGGGLCLTPLVWRITVIFCKPQSSCSPWDSCGALDERLCNLNSKVSSMHGLRASCIYTYDNFGFPASFFITYFPAGIYTVKYSPSCSAAASALCQLLLTDAVITADCYF